MQKTAKKGAKKAAPKKSTAPKKTSSITVGTERHNEQHKSSLITVHEGVPDHYVKSTESERQDIIANLALLKPNKNHMVLPMRLKTTVIRLWHSHYPHIKIRTSNNKEKKTISVWRTA